MNHVFPFDPKLRHHFLIAIGLAIWIFLFLYLTEPLDVSEFRTKEKLIYLPFYGIAVSIAYIAMLPFQRWLYKKEDNTWKIGSELLFLLVFSLLAFFVARSVYLYIIMIDEPNPYTVLYFITAIYLPALSTILPIVFFGRWAFGKYKNKKIEDQKIEIPGEGTYEGLRLQLNDVIAIKADDNYIEISYLVGTALKKQLIRNKLSVIANLFPQFIQAHRSHLVNPYHFQQYKSENGKQFIVLSNDIFAPISRTYANRVKEAIQLTTK